MSKPTRREALEAAYWQHQAAISGVALGFVRAKGGDLDDAISEANLAFVLAFYDYDPEEGELEPWIKWKVRCSLYDVLRSRLSKRIFHAQVFLDLDLVAMRESPDFDLSAILDKASQDAKLMIELAVDQPKQLWRKTKLKNDGTVRRMRRALREYVRSIGWTASKVRETFEEIYQLLTKDE